MAYTPKQLAQNRPGGTSAVTVYTKPANTEVEITQISIVNTTNADATCRLFNDDNGTTYDQTTAIQFYDTTIPANSGVEWRCHICLSTASGTIGFRTDTADALTITLWGVEVT